MRIRRIVPSLSRSKGPRLPYSMVLALQQMTNSTIISTSAVAVDKVAHTFGDKSATAKNLHLQQI